jgi:hypothetical protein
MKKLILLGSVIAFIGKTTLAQNLKTDSSAMGASYANQMFHDLETGNKGSASVTNWDIAHSSDQRSGCIRANHMAGLMVFSYPKSGITGWASFDTTGWKNWRQRYNDVHDHDKGAFSLYRVHPKYDWGTYNVNHEIVGDSLYLLAWTNGSTWVKFLKFWPVKQPTTSDLIFRYANVDGTGEVTDTLFQSAANSQNYKYYKFTGKVKPVREPNQATWDITLNRYYEPTYDPGTKTFIPYPVMGIEVNRGTKSVKVIGPTWASVIADTLNVVKKHYYQFANDLTGIGSDWKRFNQTTFKYELQDTQSYIVKSVRTPDTSYWLIHFVKFGGTSTGKVVWNTRKIQNSVGVSNLQLGTLSIYPNPTKGTAYISIENAKVNVATLTISNLNGQTLRTRTLEGLEKSNAIAFPVSGLAPGVYIITLQSADNILSQKIVIE